ncbi:MAG: sialate O-acetylesterase [Phycisphaeraceae bacterium]|nr:sialate O-acetylesterase [Phycisphaeraceae bacterium]
MIRTVLLLSVFVAGLATGQAPVKVFILAGQSNMEGKAKMQLMNHQATDSKTSKIFEHLRKGGEWIVRDDVSITYRGRHGGLTVGYGSGTCTGVELQFGTAMGDHFEEPVLLIKASWGGHSLVQKFRSPSAGLPPAAKLDEELKGKQNNVKKNNEKRNQNKPLPTMDDIKSGYGVSYRAMMDEVKKTYADYGAFFPSLKGKKLQLAGFVWFQGWNDQYGGAENEYASNMAHFIRDVRKDLKAPKLPFVIGVMGQNGSKPAKGAMLTIQKAQLSMETLPDFKGNVKAVRTDVLVDKTAEALYPEWRQRFKEWELVGGDHAYHYLGSAIWFNRMGGAFGKAMLSLMNDG